MTTILLVALGGAIGAPTRWLVNHLLRTRFAATATAGTLTVNVVGSFVLGVITPAAIQPPVTGGHHPTALMALVGIGFCGALTTFSTLALELWGALDDGRRRDALANLVLSLLLGLGAAYLGFTVAN